MKNIKFFFNYLYYLYSYSQIHLITLLFFDQIIIMIVFYQLLLILIYDDLLNDNNFQYLIYSMLPISLSLINHLSITTSFNFITIHYIII
jgi:hypothetical protein